MRYVTVFLFVVLAGCASTRTVEINSDGAMTSELNAVCGIECDAKIFVSGESEASPALASRLRVDNETLRWGHANQPLGSSATLQSVDRVELARRSTSRGLLTGLGVGVLGGGLIGALIGAASWEECEGFCLNPDSRGEAATLGGIIVGGAGGLVGLLVGAIVGVDETTIYRFRPDTAEQVSVVIGMGPTTTANGGAR